MKLNAHLTNKKCFEKNFLLSKMDIRQNTDKHVFHFILLLTLLFMVLYVAGTSVPAWYVLDDHVANLSTCASSDRYIAKHVRQNWHQGFTKLEITASLWFLNIRLEGGDFHHYKFMPFISIPRPVSFKEDIEGMLVTNVIPKGLLTLITFTLLGMGVIFSMSASSRPSRLVYYGLSVVLIVSAITTWVSVAMQSSEAFVLSVAFDLCLQYGAIKTSIALQTLTGAMSILSFILGFILIHLAMMIHSKTTFVEENSPHVTVSDIVELFNKKNRFEDDVPCVLNLENKVYQI